MAVMESTPRRVATARADDFIDIEPSHRAVFIGMTGTGKTELAKAIVPQYPYLVVLDGKAELDLPNARYAHSPEDFGKIPFRPYEPIIYQPDTQFWDRDSWDQVFMSCYLRKNHTIYVDEIYCVVENNVAPRMYLACVTRGRSRNIRTISGSQRPVWIPKVVLTEAEHHVLFTLQNPDDRKIMAGYMGEKVLLDLTDEHSFYYYGKRSGAVRECLLKLREDPYHG
jgi:energy-coupling factor transporter ATP-binding protein EcfA2